MKALLFILGWAVACCGLESTPPASAPARYFNDFEKLPEGKLPPEMLVLTEGNPVIVSEGGNKFLRLPSDPIEPYGVLLGPENANSICTRVRGETTGRRFPEFSIGLRGAGGYFLRLMPAAGELQLISDDEVVAAAPCAWTSGAWTMMKLELRAAEGGKWVLRGKTWKQGESEPANWMVNWQETEKLATGRASLNATPYSEKPVDFDDVEICN